MPFAQVPAIFGGMPEYIRKLGKKPDETRNRPPFGEMLPAIAGMVAGPVAAPVAQSAVRAASQTLPAIARKLVQRPEPMATPANNPDAELPTFQKPGMNWSEKLATLSGYLMDLDGGWGTGHADAARQRYKDRVTEAEKKFEEQRNRDLILRAAKGDMQALWELSPDAGLRQQQWNEEREYLKNRDAVEDEQWRQQFDTRNRQWQSEFDFNRMDRDRAYDLDKFRIENSVGLERARLAQERYNQLQAQGYGDPAGSGRQRFSWLPPPRQIPINVPAGVQSTLVNSDNDIMEQATKAAKNSAYVAQQSGRFVDMARNYGAQGSGPIYDVGQALSHKTSSLNSITADLAPRQREAGSGSMSDRDLELFQKAVVSVNNTRKRNEEIALMKQAAAQLDNEYLDFLQTYQAEYPVPGSLRDAQRLWNAYKRDPSNELFVTYDDGSISINQDRPDIYSWLQRQEYLSRQQDNAQQTEFDSADQIPEGAVVEDDNGQRWRKAGGRLVRAN